MRKFEVEVEARIIVPMEGPDEDSVMELAEEKLVGEIEERLSGDEFTAASGTTIIRRVQVETIEDVSRPEKVT